MKNKKTVTASCGSCGGTNSRLYVLPYGSKYRRVKRSVRRKTAKIGRLGKLLPA